MKSVHFQKLSMSKSEKCTEQIKFSKSKNLNNTFQVLYEHLLIINQQFYKCLIFIRTPGLHLPMNVICLEAKKSLLYLFFVSTHTCTIASIVTFMTMLWIRRGSSNGWPNLKSHQLQFIKPNAQEQFQEHKKLKQSLLSLMPITTFKVY